VEKSSKIYIAGHRGMVGSAILRDLQEKGYTNIIYKEFEELDLRRQGKVEEFFNNEKPYDYSTPILALSDNFHIISGKTPSNWSL